MAHVDYEGAWVELGDRLRAKPGWGSRELHELMAEIAAQFSLPENFVQKVVRLYGDSIQISISPETGAAVLDESEVPTAERKQPDPEASTTQGGHDERRAPEHHGAARADILDRPDQAAPAGSSGRGDRVGV